MISPSLLIISVIAGVVVGILSGLLGIGGGTLMVPLLRVAYGFPALLATGTSLLAIIPTSISGAITHIRNKTCVPQIGVAAGIGGAVTSVLGVQLANISPGWLVMLVAAVIIFYSAYNMFKKAIKCPKPGSVDGCAKADAGADAHTGASVDAQMDVSAQASRKDGKDNSSAPSPKCTNTNTCAKLDVNDQASGAVASEQTFSKHDIIYGALIGAVAGVASGYVGVGGGFLMVPLFLSKLNIPMKKASGTSLIAVCILAIPAVISQLSYGNVSIVAGLALAIGAIPGALFGAKMIKKVPERTLRFVFSAFLCVAALLLLIRELGIF
jgi:uncharacterized protein